jgi:hypothetical protein
MGIALATEVRAVGRDWKTWGETEVYRFPEDWTVREYPLGDGKPLSPGEIARALSAEFAYKGGRTTLASLARGKSRVVVLSDDLTRPTPAYDVVPHVLALLSGAGVPESRASFIIAGGLHRPWTREEQALKLGEDAASRFPVENHDGFYGDCVHLGTTPRGTPVSVNRRVAEADLVVTVSTLAKHRFNYATGGSKIILPGVSSRETILKNHGDVGRLRRDESHRFGPKRLDMDDAARLLEERADLVVIDATVDPSRRVTGLYVGDCVEPFHRNVDEALRTYGLEFRRSDYGAAGRADVGFFRMGFHSCDALQMSRCVDGYEEVCSLPVIICDCRDGLFYDGKRDGTWDEFGKWLEGREAPPNPPLEESIASGDYNVVFSPHLDMKSTHLKRPKMHVAHDWDAFIEDLYRVLGAGKTVAFFHDASIHILDVK